MRQIIYILLLFCLNACSGTLESQPSTLLIIGFDNKVGLLDTCLLTNVIEASCPSSERATEENERPLLLEHSLPENSEAVAFDIADRDNRRDELVVLSASSSNVRTAHLSFFGLTNIDPRPQNTQFLESRPSISLELANLVIDNDVNPEPASFCPTGVQISEEGRYVAFFSDQDVCSASLVDAIDIIDLQTNPPILVKHLELGESFPKGFYIDQIDDKLYYLQGSGSDIALMSLFLDDDLTENEEQEVISFDSDEVVVDMRALGDELVILNEEDFIIIDNFRNAATTNTAIETDFSTNRQVINDDFFRTQHFYLLSTNRFVPYNTFTQEEPENSSISAVGGTYESINTFIYLLANKAVYKFDAFTYDFETRPRLNNFTISDLDNAKFITWVQATVLE